MTAPDPGNSEEAAYLAFGLADELITMLVTRGILASEDRAELYGKLASRLSEGNSYAMQRAASFVTDRMKGEEDTE